MEISIVPVILIPIAAMVIGFVWYSMPVFGRKWMEGVGLTEEKLGSGPGVGYLLTTIASLITGIAISVLFAKLGINNLSDGLAAGALIAFGIVATTMLPSYIFGQQKASVILINIMYEVVFVLVASVLVVLF